MTALYANLSPEAREAHRHLLDVLDAADRPAPCSANPAPWDDEDPSAALACRLCPALEACAAYALVSREPVGVLGALSPADRRRVLGIPEPAPRPPTEAERARRKARQAERRAERRNARRVEQRAAQRQRCQTGPEQVRS